MAPDALRKSLGFAALAAGPLTLSTTVSAQAQDFAVSQWIGVAPMAVALGAGAFGILALVMLKAGLGRAEAARRQADARVADLRAQLDQYEAVLSGPRELTVIWSVPGVPPRILGQPAAVLAPGRPAEAALNLASWLGDADADRLAAAIEDLRVHGRGFERSFVTRDGRTVVASGTTFGGGAALRLRATADAAAMATPLETARTLLAGLQEPAILRDPARRIVYANPAWHALARRLGAGTSDRPAELLDGATRRAAEPTVITLGEGERYTFLPVPLDEGLSAGLLYAEPAPAQTRPPPAAPAPLDTVNGHLALVIDALSIPVAIFDAGRELVQFNRAYAELWGLDPAWLQPGLEERAILDRLRTDNKLPAEADYHAWRRQHLETAYSLKAPRESDPWHLPDGRTINVIAAPASSSGGVIYVFEDITDQLRLKSLNRALLDVQRSTINALTEAVAVFGTNGRLTLSNPRLSAIWKLPMNELGQNPHIDQLAAASAVALPEDGAAIWRDLKRAIVDLNPHRTDMSGRITRSDGRLLDYAVIRLPDGQTMITFLDVTESANYSRVLKERNDALITADRLKDAFVQNVSYELRSPLTNIIGFADLLASETVGPLNERQRAYTDYIRASSETLGVLIDNILDLATVDAGIAELRPEPQDVAALVEKARAGLAATFPAVDGERALNLTVEIPPGLPRFVADGTRIVQILYNLLSTATRFSEPGAAIRLAVEARGNRMVFIVDDEGTSATEELRAAMDRGADAGLAGGRQRGAALGLAIVRAFVSLHGGTIAVEKREPRGNRVVVSLPREQVAAGAAE